MIITMFRSSSLNQYVDFCQQQYYINYVLGHDSPSNLKSDMGSITHLALEWLSLLKIQYDVGEEVLKLKTGAIDVEFERDKLYELTVLSDEDVKKINKSRINKQFFLPSSQIEFGQERYGSFVVNTLINAAYKHFSEKISPHHPWTKATYKTCWNWTWMALEQFNRNYDPRFSKIISPEQRFEFEIKKPWAKYEYFLKGKKIEGYLKLKGTIDLVTEVDKDTIEIRDWKGLALDTLLPTADGWTTMGEVKVGDILFDMNGIQTKVIGKSEIKNKPCYKITFDDNSTVVCDDEHLWALNSGKVVQIKDLKENDKISIAKHLICTNNLDLPIEPYQLGYWLGYSNTDRFNGVSDGKLNITSEQLESFNLINNQYIPDIYLRASLSDRALLFNGIMDGCGCDSPNDILYTANGKLLEDTKKLLLTLGFKSFDTNKDINEGLIRNIVKIELVESQNTQCIKVDSSSSTYLCTENMIPTHNTGKMFNWGKNEAKTYETLQKDKQLMFYYYAAKHIFPQYENIMITIIFVRDGGPVTVCFDDSDYQEVENMIKEAFLSVKNNQEPKLLDPSYRDHRCNKFCAFYKKQVDGKPLCSYIKDSIDEYGIDHTTDVEMVEGHTIGKYEEPGE